MNEISERLDYNDMYIYMTTLIYSNRIPCNGNDIATDTVQWSHCITPYDTLSVSSICCGGVIPYAVLYCKCRDGSGSAVMLGIS